MQLTIVMAGSSYFFDMVVSLGFELRVLSLELSLGLELSFGLESSVFSRKSCVQGVNLTFLSCSKVGEYFPSSSSI